VDTILQDLRFAFRQLSNRRGATLVTILTLALGIGANTATFSLLNATLFKAAPGTDPERLAWVASSRGRSSRFGSGAYPDYVAFRDKVGAFSGVMAYSGASYSVGGKASERIYGNVASGNYFDVLGLKPAAGRFFTPTEDAEPGAHAVAVISHTLWTRRFGADPSVVNSTVIVNGSPFTIIGVAPAGFVGVEMGENAELWVPMAMVATAIPTPVPLLTDVNSTWLRMVARLKPGVSYDEANAEASVIAKQIVPPGTPPDDARRVSVQRIQGGLDPENRAQLLPVFGLLSLVPARGWRGARGSAPNRLVARGLSRRKEFAMRRAFGATRGRLVRQLLTECVLLSGAAGAVGVVFSFWLVALIARFGDVPAEITVSVQPDRAVLIATTLLAMLTGLLFGLVPALSATRPELVPALKDEGANLGTGRHRHRLRDTFVVAQVALSLALIITSGLFLRSIDKALRVNPGFDPKNAVTLSYDLRLQGYAPEREKAFNRTVLATVRAMPGVEAAAIATTLPLSGRSMGNEIIAEGAPIGDRGRPSQFSSISADYFASMKAPLLKGRDFATSDDEGSPKVAIVNERLASQLWPGENPIGKRFRFAGANEPLREVVGLARDGKNRSLTEAPFGYLYLPEAQDRQGSTEIKLVVRTAGDPVAFIVPLTKALQQLDPNLPFYQVQTLEQMITGVLDRQRASSSLIAVFGALALVLAALGMYGVAAHGVTLRTREIGIRMSLGARAADVLAMLVREGLRLAAVGVVAGLLISGAVSKVLGNFLYGLRATDALTFAAGAALLCAVAAIATYLPARRAARVDPMVALRFE